MGRAGTRLYSQAALQERIVTAFYEEHGDDSPLLREAQSHAQQVRLILDTTDYVLAVESILLTANQKADLIRRIHSDLFGYGPLDPYLADPDVTTIALEGPERAGIRYGSGDLTPVGTLFEDSEHFERIIARLLRQAGAELRPDVPILETGLTVQQRPISVSVAAPPITAALSVDMRLHPATPLTMDALVATGVMTEEASLLLRSLVMSPYGLMVVGESESGKTTLLRVLAALLPQPGQLASVERAGELRLPSEAARFVVRWPVGDVPGLTFGQQIMAAWERNPGVLVLDEVRADEPDTIAPLLQGDQVPRQWWSVRGAPDAKRLQAALGMLARRSAPGQGEAAVHALYERLPFVVTLARTRDRLQLFSVAEWQPNPTSDYPDYVLLLQYQDGAARPTDRLPSRSVSLG